MEADHVVYDGSTLKLRLLIGADKGAVVFDRRLIENTNVYFRQAKECETGQELPRYTEDYFSSEAVASDFIRLEPGYWFGGELEFRLFKEGGPECVDVLLTLHSGVAPMSERGDGQLLLRARRTVPGS